jgi:predicted dienelactone hydrolase
MKNTLLILFLLNISLTIAVAQSYPAGVQTITYTDSSRSNRAVSVEFHYPAISTGSNTAFASDSFPFVVFGHGFVMTPAAYYPFADTLAQRGYIVALPNTETSLSPNHSNFARDLIFIYSKLITENSNATSPLYQKIIAKGAIAGHSMGGGCAVLSAQYSNPAACYFTLAEATTSPSSITAAPFMTKPYLSFAGSYDCIAPYTTNQLPTYDSSGSPCKYLIEITGASHCQFGAGAATCNFGEGASGCANPPLSRSDQINAVLRYLEPYLDFHLKGIAAASVSFDSVYAADLTNTKTKKCPTSPNGIMDVSAAHIRSYPNPAADEVYIESDRKIKELRVLDYTGKVVMHLEANAERIKIDLANLTAGVYMVEVTTQDRGRSLVKFIKQ